MSNTPTRPRSFRFTDATLRLLGRRARERGESANRVAGRLLDEALRTDGHPLIRFREGASGQRSPALVGSRLRVAQVVRTVRDSDGSISDAAEYLNIEPERIQAGMDYYADFAEEIDAELISDDEFARRSGAPT